MRAAVLVPVKAFAAAKVRLAPALAAPDRATLARTMAERVLSAAHPLPVVVACDDDGVADWAVALGARVIWTSGLGLNGAVQEGVRQLGNEDVDLVIVSHADLPRASGLARLATFPGATLVPDRHDEGTNVIVVPPRAGFTFAYGPGSFARHFTEARRLGLALRIARSADLQWDVDTPDDLWT